MNASCIFLIAFFLVTGCVTATVQEVRQGKTGIKSDESVVVLGRKHKTRNETESRFVDCISRRLENAKEGIGVMSEDQFVDATFPWFEPRTAPLNTVDLTKVISEPLVSARIKDIGVRFLIWIEGTTERTGESGQLQCAVMAGGVPTCFGFLTWEDDSKYEASIWDVKTGTSVGRVSSEAIGTSFIPAVGLPLPIIAQVRDSACSTLSNQLKSFLSDDT